MNAFQKKRRTVALILSVALAPIWAPVHARGAESVLDGTVESYVREAMAANPGLAASHQYADAMREAAGTRGAMPDPVFAFGYFIETPETRVGPQQSSWMLNQRFPFFGKLSHDRAVASKSADIAAEAARRADNELRYDVKRAFYEYFAAVNVLDVLEQERGVLVRMEEVAQVRYGSGLVSQQDALKAQLSLSRVQDDIQVATRRSIDARVRLNELLNRRPGDELPRPLHTDSAVVLPPKEALADAAVSRRPEVRAAEFGVERAAEARALADRQYYPDLTLGAQYIQVGEREGVTMEDNGKDIFQVNASINIPLWFGRRSAGVRGAQAEQARARSEKSSWETRVRNQVVAAWERARIAAERVSFYRDVILPQAEQAFQASQADYQTGRSDFLNYLDSERMLLSMRRQYFEVLADYGTQLAQLELASGGPSADVARRIGE